MKTCSNCGNQLSDFALTCRKCGESVSSSGKAKTSESEESVKTGKDAVNGKAFGEFSSLKKEPPVDPTDGNPENNKIPSEEETSSVPDEKSVDEIATPDDSVKVAVDSLDSFGDEDDDSTPPQETYVKVDAEELPSAQEELIVETNIIDSLDSFGDEENYPEISSPEIKSDDFAPPQETDVKVDAEELPSAQKEPIIETNIIDSLDSFGEEKDDLVLSSYDSKVDRGTNTASDDTHDDVFESCEPEENKTEEKFSTDSKESTPPPSDMFIEKTISEDEDNKSAEFEKARNDVVFPVANEHDITDNKTGKDKKKTVSKKEKTKKAKEKKSSADKSSSSSKNSGKIKIAVAVIVSAVLVASGVALYFILSDKINTSNTQYTSNTQNTVNTQYTSNTQNAISEIEEIKTSFEAEQISYEYALSELMKYADNSDEDVLRAYNDAKAAVEDLNVPRKLYADGVDCLENGDYVNALENFYSISENYPKYEEVTRQIEKTKKEYKNYIFSEIDKMLGKYDFDAANNALSELKKYVNDEDVADKGIDIANAELAYDLNKWADDFVAAVDEAKENEENLMNSYRDQQKVYISGKPQLQIVSNEKNLYVDVVNAYSKATSTVYYSILEYDEFGNAITHDTVKETYVNESVLKQEVRIEPNDVYSMKDSFIHISLSNSRTKYADVCVKKVVFEDGTTWDNPYYLYWVENNNATYQWI